MVPGVNDLCTSPLSFPTYVTLFFLRIILVRSFVAPPVRGPSVGSTPLRASPSSLPRKRSPPCTMGERTNGVPPFSLSLSVKKVVSSLSSPPLLVPHYAPCPSVLFPLGADCAAVHGQTPAPSPLSPCPDGDGDGADGHGREGAAAVEVRERPTRLTKRRDDIHE